MWCLDRQLLDLLLVGVRVDLQRIRVARRLLMRALFRDQRLDDDVDVVHMRCWLLVTCHLLLVTRDTSDK